MEKEKYTNKNCVYKCGKNEHEKIIPSRPELQEWEQ